MTFADGIKGAMNPVMSASLIDEDTWILCEEFKSSDVENVNLLRISCKVDLSLNDLST